MVGMLHRDGMHIIREQPSADPDLIDPQHGELIELQAMNATSKTDEASKKRRARLTHRLTEDVDALITAIQIDIGTATAGKNRTRHSHRRLLAAVAEIEQIDRVGDPEGLALLPRLAPNLQQAAGVGGQHGPRLRLANVVELAAT